MVLSMTARFLTTRSLSGIILFGFAAISAGQPVGFDEVRELARERAERPYQQQPARVPDFLLAPQFTYDQHRDIRFRPEESLWRRMNAPFQIQFFHPGFVFNRTVLVNEFTQLRSFQIPFRRELFNYGKNALSQPIPEDMGFAGFRIHYPLNDPSYHDELAVFLGASYFRGLGVGHVYGLSARAVAVDTAEPTGEEFPSWEEFWLQRPVAGDREFTLLALVDGPSLSGAYRMVITPGAETRMKVRGTIFTRREIRSLGLAPLTSMFWYGENSDSRFGDFRPEVHDSDGLLIETGAGEWLWRPLVNPRQLNVASFADRDPKGFGLLQRDRAFSNYEDLEAGYHRRPSAWVKPIGSWGPGAVRLVEIPTPDETNDNIVAFWVPETPLKPGQPFDYEYELTWFTDRPRAHPGARVVATRFSSFLFNHPELRKFVIDWKGGALGRIPRDAQVEPVVTVGEGARLHHAFAQHNPYNDTWRVVFAFEPASPAVPVEFRCFLKHGEDILSETWSHLWRP